MQFFPSKNYFLTLIFLSIFSSSSNALENIVHWQTKAGLGVYWVYSPSPAMVDIELLFAAGSAYDGEKKTVWPMPPTPCFMNTPMVSRKPIGQKN